MYLKAADKVICGFRSARAHLVFSVNTLFLIERLGRSSRSETLNLKQVLFTYITLIMNVKNQCRRAFYQGKTIGPPKPSQLWIFFFASKLD